MSVDAQLETLVESLIAMARLDFSVSVPELGEDERLDALAVGANMLREELESSTISRSYLDGILQCMSDGVLVVERGGDVLDANRAAAELFGLSRSELASRTMDEVLPGFDWPSQTPTEPAGMESVYEGADMVLRLAVSPLDRERFVVVCTDVTTQHELREALKTARDEALASSAQRTRFLANMSHEIRTPINGVVGMAELLLGTQLDTRQRDMATTIDLCARSLLDMVNDILDFSRIDAGQLDLEALEFDIRELVDDVLQIHGSSANSKGVELVGAISPVLPRLLVGDVSRIRQVLSNLVGNAIKFTEQGEVSVFVWQDEPSGPVLFRVRDTGIGIRPDRLPDLFEPFVQADGSTTREYGGSGLGLAICRQLTEAMGGRIDATSALGEGSAFTFEIPLGIGEAAEVDAIGLEGVHVLVVDDNATNHDVLASQLAGWGARPVVAAGADEAIALLRAHNATDQDIEIALLDMQMPGRDGLQLAHDLAADDGIVAPLVLLLTSVSPAPDRTQLAAAGIEQAIHKPVRARLLRRALQTMLRGDCLRRSVANGGAKPLYDKRVLVAEDNPINQKVVLGYLQSFGMSAVCVANGREAVELADQPWDLVLMDIRMPVMDGYTAARLIRDRHPDLPIVALSAEALVTARDRAMEAGMQAFLTKPVNERRLLEVFAEVFGAEVPQADEATSRGAELPRALVDTTTLDKLAMLAKLSGDDDMVVELVDQLGERLPVALAEMRAAAEAGDSDRVAHLAHTLRGSAAQLGAMHLARAAGEVERAAEARADCTAPLDLVASLADPTLDQLGELVGGR